MAIFAVILASYLACIMFMACAIDLRKSVLQPWTFKMRLSLLLAPFIVACMFVCMSSFVIFVLIWGIVYFPIWIFVGGMYFPSFFDVFFEKIMTCLDFTTGEK